MTNPLVTRIDCSPRSACVMEFFCRKKKNFRAAVSLTLIFATLLMLQKLITVDPNIKDVNVKNKWCGPKCSSFKRKSIKAVGNASQSRGNDLAQVGKPMPKQWDVARIKCSENSTIKTQAWFRRLNPRFREFVLHRHCRYFPMLLNHPEKCSGDVDVLVVVKSVIEEHDRREAVRQTWGKEQEIQGLKIKTLFLLGTPATGKDGRNLQALVQYEDRTYGDILQWDFMDTFFNLTLKEVNFLRWFNIYCSGVPFIFKGDDDVFVHTKNLVELIGFRVEENRVENLIVGDTIFEAKPIRNHQSKYFIPKELYDTRYPPYLGGGGFLMSSQVARRLFVVSESVELYPIDDVFLGMCLQKLQIVPELHLGFRTFGIIKRKVTPLNREPCFFRNLIVVHKLVPQELMRMWNLVQNEYLICARHVVID
ncbi:UDP-GlcNAc:betaGal beta-1,3-N-acetylglucosaminyltransferase 7, like [Rhinichthys klamathensis goyatoka]|uniref:UDP-GlcNAc:betaGal beta-1,3-N-acetylglucosaminyltransferase 7, like n=1 Tax=Rhinichthys klamathensis goyatoka TaxID=3034132 RepID=UPI0024B62982|nr:UDP-GlcNAc:betaGal beta-1,3-N-acetylglucosaminyltransferase 7, like [Rhinichthys klamathensis goyatoka]